MIVLLSLVFTLLFGSLEVQAYTPADGLSRHCLGDRRPQTLKNRTMFHRTGRHDVTLYARFTEKLAIGEAQLLRVSTTAFTKDGFYVCPG